MKSSHFGVQSSDFLVNPWVNPQIVWISLNPWIYQIYLRIFKFSLIPLIHSYKFSYNYNYNYNLNLVFWIFEWLNPLFETYSIYLLGLYCPDKYLH